MTSLNFVLPPGDFLDLRSLLRIDHDYITHLTITGSERNVVVFPDTMSGLRHLRVENVRSAIPGDFLSQSLRIEKIVLRDCNAIALPDFAVRLKRLTVTGREVLVLPTRADNIEFLDISDSRPVKGIPRSYFRLKTLIANRSGISEVPDTIEDIEYIEISETRVARLPSHLPSLEFLLADKSDLAELPATDAPGSEFYVNRTNIQPWSVVAARIPRTVVYADHLDRIYGMVRRTDPEEGPAAVYFTAC